MDKGRKQSLYFPDGVLEEIEGQARRLQRTVSWVVRKAWELAREEIKAKYPDRPGDL